MKNDALVPFNPANLTEATEMSKMLAQSSLIPTSLKGKPSDVMVILMHGRELGLSPMQSLAEVYVVEGKPSSSAKLKVGLCLQHPDVCEYFRLVESSDKRAIYETKRRGSPEPTRLTWTIEQAAKAGLLSKANWKNYPEAMLRARCQSALADAVYPELVKGLAIQDELETPEEKDITPKASATESVKDKVAARLAKQEEPARDPEPTPEKPRRKAKAQVVDVEPGESEEAAEQRSNAPGAWDQVSAYAKELGYTDVIQVTSVVKGATGKDWRSLTEADIEPAKAALKFRLTVDADQAANPL